MNNSWPKSMHSQFTDETKVSSKADKENEQLQAFDAQVARLYQAGFSALFAMPIAGIILFLALKERLPLEINVIWLTTIITISAARGILLYAYNMRNHETPIKKWALYYCILEAFSGFAWGCTGFFLSYVAVEHQLLIFFILIGMVGGASAMLAPVYASYVCFSVPAMGTFSIFLMQLSNDIYNYMIALNLLALIILLSTTRVLTRYIGRTFLLAFENENLSQKTLDINKQLRDEINSRRNYEEKLHASEKHLFNILNNMQDTYYRTNIHGEIIMASPSVKELLGYTPEELKGTMMAKLYADTNGRDQFLRKLTDDNGSVVNYQVQLVHKDGHLVWVSTNAQYYYDENGIPQGVEGTTRNVDEIQKYIEQLEESRKDYQRLYEINQNILENSPIGILFVDRENRFSYINSTMQQILGVPPNARHHMLGQRFLDIPNLAKSGLSTIAKQMLEGERISIKIPYTSTYNRSSILSITGVPLNENNQFAGAIVLAEDISDKVKQEKQLINALQKADEANRTKNRFLANVSHELRTPLNAIIGMTSLLKQAEECAQFSENLDIIQHSGENLLSLVNTILTLTQLEQGDYQGDKEVMELSSYLFSLLRPQMEEAENKQLKFIIETDPFVPNTLYVDRHCIEYSLIPLVDNAVKFTKQGYVKFKTSLLSQDNNQAVIRFNIEDSGKGMESKQLDNFFDYFSIEDDASNRRHDGLGLGTTVAKQLIEANGGEINVRSEKDQGTQIEVTLSFELSKEVEANDAP